MAYYSIRDFIADGTTSQYDVNFQFISRSHVSITVDGIESSFTWVNATRVQMTDTPTSGKTVRIRRITPRDGALVDYIDGGPLTEAYLDLSTLQNIMICQETLDELEITKYQVNSLSITTGNVPVASPVIDNNKILTASDGGFNWSNTFNLQSGTLGSLNVTGNATIGGSLNVIGVFNVATLNSATMTAQTLNVVSTLNTPSVTVRTSTGSPVVEFDRGVVSGTSPQFRLQQSSGATQMVVASTDGSTVVNHLTFTRSGSSSTTTIGTGLFPDTDGTRDIGASSANFGNLFIKGKRYTPRIGCQLSVTNTLTNNLESFVQWGTKSDDTDNMWSSGSPSKIKINTAGVYVVCLSAEIQSDSNTGYRQMSLKLNGNLIAYDCRSYTPAATYGTTATSTPMHLSQIITCTSGDELRAAFVHSTGSTKDVKFKIQVYRIDS